MYPGSFNSNIQIFKSSECNYTWLQASSGARSHLGEVNQVLLLHRSGSGSGALRLLCALLGRALLLLLLRLLVLARPFEFRGRAVRFPSGILRRRQRLAAV